MKVVCCEAIILFDQELCRYEDKLSLCRKCLCKWYCTRALIKEIKDCEKCLSRFNCFTTRSNIGTPLAEV